MKILIAGGGIAGLGAALALRGKDRQILIYDRDPVPPSGTMDEVFDGWQRPGATQLRQSHVFLARFHTLIRDRHPELMRRLFDAGVRELTFHDSLPSTLRRRYRPRRGDRNLSMLFCRRTTLESVLRGYVQERSGVTLIPNAKIRGLLLDAPLATGLKIERDGTTYDVGGEIVIDATGRNTPFPDWLGAEGITVPTEEAPSGIIYYTRHYKMRPGREEPRRSEWFAPTAGDLGYIRYGVFPADDGHFSVTLSVPEIEDELRKRILDGDQFDRICASFPGVMRWTDPARAEPATKVQGMGKLNSVWRNWAPGGVPLVHGFFAIGDATMRTNPFFGRGCSTGFIQAHILADVFRKTRDPTARAKLFDLQTRAQLRPFYDSMVRQDAAAIELADQINRDGRSSTFASRLARSLAEHGVVPAVRREEHVLRALMQSLHMLHGPDDWMREPRVVSRIVRMWATPRPLKARFYPGKLGPARGEMLELLRAS